MNQFSKLYDSLQRPISESDKITYLIDYLKQSSPQDIMWTLSFLLNHPQSRIVKSAQLKKWGEESINLPNWLMELSHKQVGDQVETISILVPKTSSTTYTLSKWMTQISKLSKSDVASIHDFVSSSWKGLSLSERYVFNKIVTGSLRINVDQKTIIQAVAIYIGQQENKVALRLQKDWSPEETTFEQLLVEGDWIEDHSKHYPFNQYELIKDEELTSDPSDYWITWDHEGLSAQLVVRDHEVYLWSDHEELVTSKFPELELLKQCNLHSIVIEGKVAIFQNGQIQESAILEKRMKKKKVVKKDLKDHPAIFIATDILESNGHSTKYFSFVDRRKLLTSLVEVVNAQLSGILFLSELLEPSSWDIMKNFRELAKTQKAKGLLLELKKQDTLRSIKKRKWTPAPLTIKAILLYAQKGQARASNEFSELTFAVWKNDKELIPISKVRNTLIGADSIELKDFVKKNTVEKFGPVRSVRPELVFKISFSKVNRSERRKSGMTLDNPKIISWEKDLKPSSAIHLTELNSLIS